MKTAFVEIRNDKIISYFDVNHSVDDPNDFRPPRYMKVQKPLRNCAVTYDPNTKMLIEDTTKSEGVKSSDFKILRSKRDRLLTETDWTQCPDNSLSDEERIKYQVYRQKLRDITNTDSAYYVEWPTLNDPILIPPPPVDKTFTGHHTCFVSDDVAEEGMVVCANQNKYGTKGTQCSNAITINESTPNVSLCSIAMDKSCFGVISRTFGHRRAFINSVGEGAMWVTDINGSLESGDYITTSNVAGYGQRQDDDILHNYTVAKITMDCDFNPVTQPIQKIKKELGDVNYWVKTTYENVPEEEYSNLTEESRRTITEIVYTNEDGETFTEQNEEFTYVELEQTIYQKITNEESKTEQEGYELEVRQELVNVLDEHGQLQWEDHPTETEKAYKIRYLDADGNITDEANHVYKAAFVGCTYHCG